MTIATRALHLQGPAPEEVEQAFLRIFAREGRAPSGRLQGMYAPVLARMTSDAEAEKPYRYLVLPARAGWISVIELGNRADGLEVALSGELAGCPVLALTLYADAIAGYQLARNGAIVDSYLSDPDYFNELAGEENIPSAQAVRGQPERFVDLLPAGTTPDAFREVVLRPGWWAEHDGDESAEEVDLVDEADRMRCLGLAFEVWGPEEYPFAGELEDVPPRAASPAIALAFL